MARTELMVAIASVLIVAGVIAIPLASPSAVVAPRPTPAASSHATADPNGLVGPGCATYSAVSTTFSKETVAQAIAGIPTLSSFSAAISGKTNPDVNLVAKFDGSEYTVFAPVDAAFAKLPVATLTAFKNPADATQLAGILEYHAVPTQIAPTRIAGTHTTVQGETLTVSNGSSGPTIGAANVVCGGIHTSNATLYLIDTVLTPPGTN